jgi:hypothetical protein
VTKVLGRSVLRPLPSDRWFGPTRNNTPPPGEELACGSVPFLSRMPQPWHTQFFILMPPRHWTAVARRVVIRAIWTYRRSATRSQPLVLCVALRIGYWVLHPMTSRRLKATRFTYVRNGLIGPDNKPEVREGPSTLQRSTENLKTSIMSGRAKAMPPDRHRSAHTDHRAIRLRRGRRLGRNSDLVRWPPTSTLAIASRSAFGAIALGQVANAFACRSETQPVWRQRLGTNRLLIGAVTAELVLLWVFLGFPPLARPLGGSWPPTLGWALAFCAVPIVIIVDASYKALRRSRSRELALASVRTTSDDRR